MCAYSSMGETKMLSDPCIMLYLLHNEIQHSLPDVQIGFHECNEVLAIMRMDPYALLQLQEPRLVHTAA